MIKLHIRDKWVHIFLPMLFLGISKFNESYYLSADHGNLLPLYFVRVMMVIFLLYISIQVQKRFTFHKISLNSLFPENKRLFLGLFIWFLVWFGYWLVVYYPGSYTIDTLDAIQQIKHMRIHDWFSYLHPLTYLILYQIYPNMLIIGIAQAFLVSFIFADVISYLFSKLSINSKVKVTSLIIFILFISCNTSIIYYTFFYMRDIPYSFLHFYFAFYIFKLCIENQGKVISNHSLSIIIVWGLILALYRGEGFIILLTTLLALFLYGKYRGITFIKLLIMVSVLFFILNWCLPKFLNVHSTNKNYYKLTLIAYPLGFILGHEKEYISDNHQEDIDILSKVVDIEGIKQNTNCYDIEIFQLRENQWNRNASNNEWEAFYNRAYQIFFKNVHLFLSARTANFFAQLFAFKGRAERTNDIARDNISHSTVTANQLNLKKILQLEIPSCIENNKKCGINSMMVLEKFSFNWHWNSVMALVLSTGVLFLYGYVPISAIAASIILSRIPLVFLTAPYAFVRYVYSLYLFGLFILLFVVVERWCVKKVESNKFK